MKILKTQWLEEMKDWTKKTMVEKDEKWKFSNDNDWENLEMVELKKIEKFWKFMKESNKNF